MWDADDLGVAVARLIVRYLLPALPVLFRLWRGKGTASQVDLAAQMLTTMTGAFPGRIIHGAGDAAFHGTPLICENSTWTTRLPANAVLFGPAPARTGKRGRPRKKGTRLGTPAQIAGGAHWQTVTVNIYGQARTVQAAVTEALWHGSFKDAPGQAVLVREPGSSQPYDLALFTLDGPPPPPPPSSNGTPGGGPSSRPTPQESRFSASEKRAKVSDANRLSLNCPDDALLSQWGHERNYPLTPDDISIGARRKVWWRCSKADDHRWQAEVSKRVGAAGAPSARGIGCHPQTGSQSSDPTSPCHSMKQHPISPRHN